MNLKQAAARLGIHYQTAYKLVRSGALVAVRVGGTYEISEAAIQRYLVEREAQRADPVARRSARAEPVTTPEGADERAQLLATVVQSVEGVTLSAQGVFDTATQGAAETLGDLAVLALLDADDELQPASYHHRDPARRSVLAAVVAAHPPRAGAGLAGRVMSTGEALFLPHVPQDQLRASTRPELLQYLDEIGVHSVIVVPVRHGGRVLGVLTVSRDYPGHPFTRDDLALLHDLGRLLGVAIRRVERFRRGWERRQELVEAAGTLLASELHSPADCAALLDDGPMLEVVLDHEGRLVAMNEPAVAFAGRLPEGAETLDIVDPAERHAERRLMARLLVGELSFHDGERMVRNVTGEPVRIVVHRGVVRAPDASPRAVLLVGHPAIGLGLVAGAAQESRRSPVAS